MSFLRSRHEQLIDHLREQIQRGQLVEPLPNARDWAGQLGVSCTTLYAALHVLAREQLLIIRPRKEIRINPVRPVVGAPETRLVRLVYRGSDYPESAPYYTWWGLLSQRLQPHGIQFSVEKCTDARLRQLGHQGAGAGTNTRELLLLMSLSEHYQRLLWRAGKPALVVGYPAPGIPLPYVTCDLIGAIRHATNAFLQRGFQQLHLLINRVKLMAVERQCEAFQAACSAWSRQPVVGSLLRVPLRPAAQISTLCRFAETLRERTALVVIGPVAAGAVVTALLRCGVRIPQQVQFVIIDGAPASMVIWPLPVQYAAPPEGFVTHITRGAIHYFQTGVVPHIRKTLSMELVKPGQRPRLHSPAHW